MISETVAKINVKKGVNLLDLSPPTRSGFALAWHRRFGQELGLQLGLTDSYLLAEVLKDTPDDPEIFPKGKWASIQVLEGLIREAI